MANKKHQEQKENEVEHREEQQSLEQMLATIGSYLPKRLFGQTPQPSDWRIAQGSVVGVPRSLAKQPTGSK